MVPMLIVCEMHWLLLPHRIVCNVRIFFLALIDAAFGHILKWATDVQESLGKRAFRRLKEFGRARCLLHGILDG